MNKHGKRLYNYFEKQGIEFYDFTKESRRELIQSTGMKGPYLNAGLLSLLGNKLISLHVQGVDLDFKTSKKYITSGYEFSIVIYGLNS